MKLYFLTSHCLSPPDCSLLFLLAPLCICVFSPGVSLFVLLALFPWRLHTSTFRQPWILFLFFVWIWTLFICSHFISWERTRFMPPQPDWIVSRIRVLTNKKILSRTHMTIFLFFISVAWIPLRKKRGKSSFSDRLIILQLKERTFLSH